MAKGSLTARLIAAGWERSDAPADLVGECASSTGCIKAGRWTHPVIAGAYCAQHAAEGGLDPNTDSRWRWGADG